VRWLNLQQRGGRSEESDEIVELDHFLLDEVLGHWTGAPKRDLILANYMLGQLDIARILCEEWAEAEKRKIYKEAQDE